jgi:hypothetical protein
MASALFFYLDVFDFTSTILKYREDRQVILCTGTREKEIKGILLIASD